MGEIQNRENIGKTNEQFIAIGNLSYTYINGGNSNQLECVIDASANATGFKDVPGTDYSCDANGILTKIKHGSINVGQLEDSFLYSLCQCN